jgi:hypothetical protein
MSIAQTCDDFDTGDVVVLTTDGYSKGIENPYIGSSYACTGVITHIGKDRTAMSIIVQWENGCQNQYSKKDLKLYKSCFEAPKQYKSIW